MNTDELLELARTRMDEAVEADRQNRLEELDDLEKLVGKQWPEAVRRERETEGKPILTFNRLPQFVRQVTGDIRRMNPAIKVLPADDDATQEIAELYEGLIRQIEYASDASSIYEKAAEQAAASSIGWLRVLTEYESDDSFNQVAKIEGIRNPLSVYCDPAAQLPTREDAGFIFITDQMRMDAFKKAYPGKRCADAEHDARTDGLEHWHHNDKVVIAEYYWKEPVTREIVMLEDGRVLPKAEAVAPMRIVKTRKVNTHKVMWAKISGVDVLEGPQEVPCEYIPVIAVTGEEWHVADRVHRSSVIRYAKDAQQMYNFFRSSQAEFAAIQPKAPYLVTKKQVAGYESLWAQANRKNYPFLYYNPDEKAPGAPQRATPPISSQAMFEQAMTAADDMKATTGISDAALGNQSNEKSGVAIRQRQMESDVSTSIYADNMGKAIAYCGRILLSMIPRIYDTFRKVRVMGPDEQEKIVPINGRMTVQNMSVPVNDLSMGKYDIRVAVGPNYATRRQEVAEGMTEFIRVLPQAGAVTADLVAKAMDWPDADKFAERLKRTLPPGIAEEEDGQDPRLMQAMQMIQQLQQQLQMVTQAPEMRKANAEASEAEADAQKAGLEVMDSQLELAAKSGQLNAAIAQQVQMEVARVLQAMMQVQPGQRPIM